MHVTALRYRLCEMTKSRPVLLLAALALPAWGDLVTDEATGLVIDPGWELVRDQCGVCHDVGLVTQNRGDADRWRSIIDWMVETEGLWDLSDTEEPIIAYLSTNYGRRSIRKEDFRRHPIEPHLLPQLTREQ